MNGEPGSGPVSSTATGERAGDVVDRYELIEETSEGGMGSVWGAHQSEPVRRDVAFRICPSAVLSSLSASCAPVANREARMPSGTLGK